jgi:hypothetical protein
MLLKRLKPGVSKYWLITVAGLMWSTTGVMLCRLAYRWVIPIRWNGAILLGLISILLASAAYRFGFSKSVRERQVCLRPKGPIFA